MVTASSTVIDSQEVPSFLKALYISGLENMDEDTNVGEAIDEDPRDGRSRSVLEKTTLSGSINPFKDFGVSFKQALKTRDISAGANTSRLPVNSQPVVQVKPPRDRSNPNVQTKILQQNNYF